MYWEQGVLSDRCGRDLVFLLSGNSSYEVSPTTKSSCTANKRLANVYNAGEVLGLVLDSCFLVLSREFLRGWCTRLAKAMFLR